MMILVQTLSGIVGVVAFTLFAKFGLGEAPNSVPVLLYILSGFVVSCAGTWLYARWKYGKGTTVTPSRRVD